MSDWRPGDVLERTAYGVSDRRRFVEWDEFGVSFWAEWIATRLEGGTWHPRAGTRLIGYVENGWRKVQPEGGE